MATRHNLFESRQTFSYAGGRTGTFYSLPALEAADVGAVSRLPVCLRILLESVLRNVDGERVQERDVRELANWQPGAERTGEIPFVVARIVLQDFTGVPLLVDLAAMRSAVARMRKSPDMIEPLVPVDLVIDHSVQVDYFGSSDALQRNMDMEFKRNRERYEFLKWGTQAFKGLNVVPPGIGIVHQVNLEYLATGVTHRDGLFFPDTLVGTDSHTTMINGLGVVGWGVGGIEAEAAMLGQPVYLLTPDVVGVHLSGRLKPGVTATDLVLRVTEMLRQAGVVGKFVEFYGAGAASLTVTDRATIGNMAPEYGATIGYFPVDEQSCAYMEATGRGAEQVDAFRRYFKAQGMFGMPRKGEISYSQDLDLDLASVAPSVAGPKRPQDRIDLPAVKSKFRELLVKPVSANGYDKSVDEADRRFIVLTERNGGDTAGKTLSGGGEQDPGTVPVRHGNDVSLAGTSVQTEVEMIENRPTPDRVAADAVSRPSGGSLELRNGAVIIAAITSCTNTSNPSVMLAAGLLARKAVEKGLSVGPAVKTSLAPGSRVVTEYLRKTGLQPYLDKLGFELVGYGCTTCIGNSGPLPPHIDKAISEHDLVVASVLSGNRNFEARVHQSVKANFLMSPPLVVAFAIAGRVDIDMTREPLGKDRAGRDVYLKDLWPSPEEIEEALRTADDPDAYRRLYTDFTAQNPLWASIPRAGGDSYAWKEASTYIQEPPYFEDFEAEAQAPGDVRGARALAVFGDSVTTDHISPAGAIKATSPAGLYLQDRGVPVEDFNSYGSRRGNHNVMMRGTFANVRIRNLLTPDVEGGVTMHQPDGERLSIYDAALKYRAEGVPLLVFAGQEYGSGSSRDWAAKGTQLLGVKAVLAQSYERIHRSNLVMMGVAPCQFKPGVSVQSLGLDGSETFDLVGLAGALRPRQDLTLRIHRATGKPGDIPVTLRIDTPIEVDYYRHGGILPFVLRQLLAR